MHRDLKHVPAVEPAAAGISLALGECEMLCWLVVKSAMSNNIGLMAAPVAGVVGG
jgi:L-serine deaminase